MGAGGGQELGRLAERMKPLGENGLAALALLEMDALEGDAERKYHQRARRALESVAGVIDRVGVMAAGLARGRISGRAGRSAAGVPPSAWCSGTF